MTSDPSPSLPIPTVAQTPSEGKRNPQVRLKSHEGRILLILPSESETNPTTSWTDMWEQLKLRLSAGERFWQPNIEVHLMAKDQLLDGRQLQAIADALTEEQLKLKLVHTSRRQTAVAAAAAGYSVEQSPPVVSLSSKQNPVPQLMVDPLYLQMTVRSGIEIRHPGTVVILGDVNPGGSIIAAGDIVIWGRLRGFTYAGSEGNSQSLIMALQMEPTQLRIANHVARAPETQPAQFYPEVAYVTPEGIRIARASDFPKTYFGKTFERGVPQSQPSNVQSEK